MSEPVIHDAHASPAHLLAECAQDYAEGQAYRRGLAGDDEPGLGPELLALVTESVAARLDHGTP